MIGVGLDLATIPILGGVGGGISFAALTLSITPTMAFSVRKVAGTATPFGRDQDGNDVPFLNNGLQATSGRFARVYEQIGGSLYADQANDNYRPWIDPVYGKIGNNQSLMFDSANSGVQIGRRRELNLPVSLALPSQDHTVIHVVQNVTGNAASGLGGLANANGVSLDPVYEMILQGIALKGTAVTNQTQGVYPPCNPGVFAFGADASNTRLAMFDRTFNRTKPTSAVNSAGGKIGNAFLQTGTISAASWAAGVLTLTTSVAHSLTPGMVVRLAGLTSTNGVVLNGEFATTTGTATTTLKIAVASDPGTIGFGSGVFYNNLSMGTYKWLGSFYYTPALTPTQQATAIAELAAQFGLQTSFDTQIIYEGDSNTEGTSSSACRVACVLVLGSLRKQARVHNFGNFGNTAQAVAALGTGRYSISAAGWTQTSRLGLIALGTNDCIGSRTDTQIFADLQTIVNSMVSVGITQVVLRTIPKASSITSGKETVRQSVNAGILGGTVTGLAGVSDIASISSLQTPNGDGLHFDPDQQATIALCDSAVLNPLSW